MPKFYLNPFWEQVQYINKRTEVQTLSPYFGPRWKRCCKTAWCETGQLEKRYRDGIICLSLALARCHVITASRDRCSVSPVEMCNDTNRSTARGYHLRSAQSDVTELNRTDMVKLLTNGQPIMHYSRQRLTPSVVYVTTLTYASTNGQ